MANRILLYSSAAHGMLHLFYLFMFLPFMYQSDVYTFILPIVTSLWNHASTSRVACMIDRFVVRLLLAYYLWFAEFAWMRICMIVATMFYLMAKALIANHGKGHVWIATMFHALSHIAASLFLGGWVEQRILNFKH
jgi:hypothetical protein